MNFDEAPFARISGTFERSSATAIDPKQPVGNGWGRLPLAEHGYSGRVFVLVWAAGDWRDERDPETGGDPLLGCGRL